MNQLSTEQIRALYTKFSPNNWYAEWIASYKAVVEDVAATSDEELRKPEHQEQLWRARDISSIGSGEAVAVKGAYEDAEIAASIVGLRSTTWPSDPQRRAEQIQAAYDHVLNMVRERHSKMRPNAKLARVFAALLPAQTHTCFSWPAHKNVTGLVLGAGDLQLLEGAVLIRARLRQVLGDEATTDEHVRRSTFCWWLHEHRAEIETGTDLGDDPAPPRDPATLLALWPPTKQRRGITSVSGYVATYRAVVGAAQQGATAEDIAATIQVDLGDASPKHCRRVFNQVRRLGFLANRDGLWHPSDDGEELVETDPPDVLVRKLLVQTFGFAHLLRALRTDAVEPRALYAHLQAVYPSWTTTFAPSAIAGWARSLGLIESNEQGRLCLTEYGRTWEAQLPADLPVPPPQAEDDDEDLQPREVVEAQPWPGFERIRERFSQDDELRGFVFTPEQVQALHAAWHCSSRKRFVILSGLSGTGKTALLVHYARVYLNLLGMNVQSHRAIVPVSPDWRDPAGLLGYLNALHADPTFQVEPALRIVLDAAKNPHLPYFLILDEMNLARVERYFAPFLSAMETGEDLVLHAHDEPVNRVPAAVRWPTNLFIGGTVNMDETTHAFSDKVLDRAFTLEFWSVDLKRFFEQRAHAYQVARDTALESLLTQLNEILFDVRRHFGYRTAGEVLDFVAHAKASNGDSSSALRDQAVFSKVLPRLRGEDSPQMRDAVDALRGVAKQHGLTACDRKLEEMRQRLETSGVTRFWT